jgi:hypothetical protein
MTGIKNSSTLNTVKAKPILKVLTNEKRGVLREISFNRSPFKLFLRKFSKESVQAHPLRGLELLREPCLYHLQSIIASKYRYSIGAL